MQINRYSFVLQVAMFVSMFHAENEPEDKTKAILFGISLIPLLFNPVVTFGLRVDCRNEFIKHWSRLKKRFVAKKIQKTVGKLSGNM